MYQKVYPRLSHEVLRPLPLSGYIETHPDRGRGTGPLPLSGCVSTYPDRGRGLKTS